MFIYSQLSLHQLIFQRGNEGAFCILRPTRELFEECKNLRGCEIAELGEDVQVGYEIFVRQCSTGFAELWEFRDIEFRVEEFRSNGGSSVDDKSRPTTRDPAPKKLFSGRSSILKIFYLLEGWNNSALSADHGLIDKIPECGQVLRCDEMEKIFSRHSSHQKHRVFVQVFEFRELKRRFLLGSTVPGQEVFLVNFSDQFVFEQQLEKH